MGRKGFCFYYGGNFFLEIRFFFLFCWLELVYIVIISCKEVWERKFLVNIYFL